MQPLNPSQVKNINVAAQFVKQDAMRLIDYTNRGAARTIEQRLYWMLGGCENIVETFIPPAR